jgi:hypothetical protein
MSLWSLRSNRGSEGREVPVPYYKKGVGEWTGMTSASNELLKDCTVIRS